MSGERPLRNAASGSLRTAGDQVGIAADPETVHTGVVDGGLTTGALAEQFHSVAAGVDLKRADPTF